MIILGIDPGTATTGIGLIEYKKSNRQQLDCLYYGIIATPANVPLENRLEMLYNDLTKIIKKYKPTILAVESLYFLRTPKQ